MTNRLILTFLLMALFLSSALASVTPGGSTQYAILTPADTWFQKQLDLLYVDEDDETVPKICSCKVFPMTVKPGDPRAEISAYVTDPAGIGMVYAVVGDRFVLMMDLDGDDKYKGYCGSNLPPGDYNVTIVGVDRAGNPARSGDMTLSVLDPSDLNANKIEDCLENLGSEEMRVIVLHEGNLSEKDTPIGKEQERFKILAGSSVTVPGDRIQELSRQKGVKGVYEDKKLTILSAPGTPKSRPEDPRKVTPGLNGEGVTVALLDTGADPGHESLDDMDDDPLTDDPKIIGFRDFVNGLDFPYDDNGHGTHCASLISGTKGIGVAPGTRLVVVKVMDRDGACYLSDAITALDWVVEKRDEFGIRVISLSVGGVAPSDGTSLLDQACNRMVDQGLVVCVAAGNWGPGGQSIAIPGNAEKVITVGAIDSDGEIFGQSSRGPTPDGRIKPDIVTIGVDVASALAGSGNAESTMSGTSMAAPQVSGAAAILVQKNSGLSPADLKRTLLKSADDLGRQNPDNTFGYGAMNLSLAISEMDSLMGSAPRLGEETSPSKAEGKVGDPVYLQATFSGDPEEVRGLVARVAGQDKSMEIPMMDFDDNDSYTACWETSFWPPGNYTVEVVLTDVFGKRNTLSFSFRLNDP